MARWGSMVVKLLVVNTVCAINCDKVKMLVLNNRGAHTGSFLFREYFIRFQVGYNRITVHLPTFEVASVKLFNVVDFPLDGCMPLVSGVREQWRGTTYLSHQSDQRISTHIQV